MNLSRSWGVNIIQVPLALVELLSQAVNFNFHHLEIHRPLVPLPLGRAALVPHQPHRGVLELLALRALQLFQLRQLDVLLPPEFSDLALAQ